MLKYATLLLFVFPSIAVLGQREKFVEVDTVQGVEISARWAKASIWSFGENQEKALLVRFDNDSNEKVKVIYNLSFYEDGMKKYTTPNDTVTVKSNRKSHPRMQGNGIVLKDDLTSEELCWEFGVLDITAIRKE